MTSFTSRIRRRKIRSHSDYEKSAQEYRDNPDGGYSVLHPTKGWRRVSGKRLVAQAKMLRLKGMG